MYNIRNDWSNFSHTRSESNCLQDLIISLLSWSSAGCNQFLEGSVTYSKILQIIHHFYSPWKQAIYSKAYIPIIWENRGSSTKCEILMLSKGTVSRMLFYMLETYLEGIYQIRTNTLGVCYSGPLTFSYCIKPLYGYHVRQIILNPISLPCLSKSCPAKGMWIDSSFSFRKRLYLCSINIRAATSDILKKCDSCFNWQMLKN